MDKKIKIKTLNYFNNIASGHYKRTYVNNPLDIIVQNTCLNKIKDKIEYPLLDVGCGSGGIVEKLKPTMAVDFSEAIIKEAKKVNPNIKFKVADAQDLPFEDNEFNTVFSRSCIQHCENPQQVVNELVRVAKKRVIIMANLYKKYKLDTHPFIVHRFSEEYLRNILKEFDYSFESLSFKGMIYYKIPIIIIEV